MTPPEWYIFGGVTAFIVLFLLAWRHAERLDARKWKKHTSHLTEEDIVQRAERRRPHG
jgi:hypothetical protein